MRAALLLPACAAPAARACSHFRMDDAYGLTVRTMDYQDVAGATWQIMTVPAGARAASHGYAAFVSEAGGAVNGDLQFAGINDAGLTCDLNALLGTQYPANSTTLPNLPAPLLCKWALERFGSVAEVKAGLAGVNFVADPAAPFGAHWALRDAGGHGVVIEFLDGEMRVHDDDNDAGKTGFGIMTNEPPLPWQIEAVRHLHWKQSLARPSVAMPGAWYPDERFQRIHLVKSGMPAPHSYAEAVMHAVHVLNTVTVPMGDQLGTDSGKGSGEGRGDHTQWGVIYDHANRTIFWRSAVNQNLQRLRLADAAVGTGGQTQYLPVFAQELPWFHDAAKSLAPNKRA